MTLVLSASKGGLFAVMTSDFRCVQPTYKEFDLEAGIVKIDRDVPFEIYDKKEVKTHKLNERVLIGAGGIAELAVYLVDMLKREVKNDHDLADCKEILENVIERERLNEEGPFFLRLLDIDETPTTIFMNGFYRDGSTGLISFTTGKGSKVQEKGVLKGGTQYGMIAPALEYVRHEDKLFDIPELKEEATYKGGEEALARIILIVKNHLLMLHGLISYNHQVEISPDLELHLITLVNDSYAYRKETLDISGTYALFDKIRKKTISENHTLSE